MNFLLDTSVVIDIESVDLDGRTTDVSYVSAVTIAELAHGLDTDDPIQRAARYERFYWILDECDVLPFEQAAAKHYGTLCALLRRAGRNPGPRRTELQVAATAVTYGLPLLTRHPDDFRGAESLVDVVAI